MHMCITSQINCEGEKGTAGPAWAVIQDSFTDPLTLSWTVLPEEAVKGGVKSSLGAWFWQLICELYK